MTIVLNNTVSCNDVRSVLRLLHEFHCFCIIIATPLSTQVDWDPVTGSSTTIARLSCPVLFPVLKTGQEYRPGSDPSVLGWSRTGGRGHTVGDPGGRGATHWEVGSHIAPTTDSPGSRMDPVGGGLSEEWMEVRIERREKSMDWVLE